MVTVNIHEAKTNLSRLVERVEAGEEVVIARSGKPVAKLVPLARDLTPRPLGTMRGLIEMADDFDDALPPEIEASFYGVTPEELDRIFPARKPPRRGRANGKTERAKPRKR